MLIAIAVVVGVVVTILIISLFILYAVRAEMCCCRMDPHGKHKPSDIERYNIKQRITILIHQPIDSKIFGSLILIKRVAVIYLKVGRRQLVAHNAKRSRGWKWKTDI